MVRTKARCYLSPSCHSTSHTSMRIRLYSRSWIWRGARVADSDDLENRCPRKGSVGSNPTLSAIPCLTRAGGLMIDKGRRDVILSISDGEPVKPYKRPGHVQQKLSYPARSGRKQRSGRP